MKVAVCLAIPAAWMLAGCGAQPVGSAQTASAGTLPRERAPKPAQRHVRATGVVQAVRSYSVQVPQIHGQGGRITLTRLVANGSRVKPGDLLAEFDQTQQLDMAREAQAKFDDLNHQLEQKKAENRSNAAKRSADLRQAEADLAKARLQLRKGPLLAEIDRLKAEVRFSTAEARVAGLKRAGAFHEETEAAAVRILELQRDRQKVALDRARTNVKKLEVRATLAGMVALENVWRSGSMCPAQEGDQLWSGQPLVRIFDPTYMVINTGVSEPDGAALVPGSKAKVRLDAYPEAVFDAHFESASPVAAAAMGSPIKTFAARFRIDQVDPRLLPDLSAAVDIEVHKP